MQPLSDRYGGEAHRKERLSYVVLQHVQNLAGDAGGSLAASQIAADLAIPAAELREILEMLTRRDLVEWDGTGGVAIPTHEGTDYLRRAAGRRRSVRFQAITRPRPFPALRLPLPPTRRESGDW